MPRDAPSFPNDARSDLRLRPIVEADRFRLRRWLAQPRVVQWWGSRAAADAMIALAAQTPSALVRIIERDGEPIGYAHALDIAEPRLRPATWTADAFIGAPLARGQGLGAKALALLATEIFATTLASALAVRVSIRNERSVRAIERSGFGWHSFAADPALGPCWWLIAVRRGEH